MCPLLSSYVLQYLHSPGVHIYIFIPDSKSSFAACSNEVIIFLLCASSFVPESFESFSLRYISVSPKSQGFWTLQEFGLETCCLLDCQKCSESTVISSLVSYSFSTFACALWHSFSWCFSTRVLVLNTLFPGSIA